MTVAVFVDTNIIIYARDRRDEMKQRIAAERMQQLWREQQGRISIQVLKGCSLLLTEDLHHGALFDSVRVVNPFLSQVHEGPEEYRVPPVSRHRPRGRPRKQEGSRTTPMSAFPGIRP